MNPKEVIEVLNSLKDPFNTMLNSEVCDKHGRLLKDGSRPILRFRDGEFGKIRSSIDFIRKTYSGEGEDPSFNWRCRGMKNSRGSTYCAFSLVDAIGYSLRRSCQASGGGRYNPVTGELLPEYRWDFPFLIAIDIRKYLKRHSMNFTSERPEEITIGEPVLLRDIALLFGPKLHPYDPWNKSIMANHLASVNGSHRNQSYIELLQRQYDASLEDAVVEPPELIRTD
ncbi:hypothetical protein A3K73_08165 [Candidatus Pacearchaeota archaeon RBG_13_36_9]|nr:MAG: hypothetical protein A3K73_08165 [Candidatus Pacearchaeota archaeon RBG_13_36_9]